MFVNADDVKLRFLDKKVFHNPKKKTTVVVVKVDTDPFWDFKGFKKWDDKGEPIYTMEFSGKAVCSKDDTYNEKKGYLIASARAENEAYLFAKNLITKELKARAMDFKKLASIREDISEYREHNKKYIKSIANS